MKRITLLILSIFVLGSTSFAATVRYEPYDGGWAPAGSWAILQYFTHSSGNTFKSDGDTVSRNGNFKANVNITRLATWQDFGLPVHFSLLLPYGDISIEGVGGSSGIGDLTAIACAKVLDWRSGYLNLDLNMSAPTGAYDHNANMNLGGNYWLFRAQLAMGQDIGRFHIDLWAGLDSVTDNDNYGPAKSTLKKDIVYFTEIHAAYVIIPENKTFAAVSLGGSWGGKEKVSGTEVTGNKSDYGVKSTLGLNLTEKTALMINYLQDLHVENGPKTNQVMLRMVFAL